MPSAHEAPFQFGRFDVVHGDEDGHRQVGDGADVPHKAFRRPMGRIWSPDLRDLRDLRVWVEEVNDLAESDQLKILATLPGAFRMKFYRDESTSHI